MLALIVAGCSNVPAGTGSSDGNNQLAVTLMPTGISIVETGTGGGNNQPVETPMPTGTSIAETGTGSSGGNTAAANHEKAVKFAECMRNNGVSKFPDPDASGEFTIDEIANGSSVDTSSAAFKQAIDACKDLEPAGFTGHKRNPQEQENALKFAQCVRDNGVPDFPDPTVDEPLIDTNRIPSAAGKGGMTILHAAMDKCRDIIADQLKGQ
jgi:hypothetical protein